MKRVMLGMMLVGAALLGVILYRTDLREVWRHLLQLGWQGFAVVLLVYLACALAQVGAWLFTLPGVPPRPAWFYRLWKVWMVGFAMEATTPLAGFGGEPAKAMLLKRHYGIRYREATASIVLARTTDMTGQIVFICIGFALMFRDDSLALAYRLTAGSGLAVMVLFVALFFGAQQQRTFGRIRRWLERGWFGGRRLSARAMAVLESLHDIDERLLAYYAAERGRLAASIACAFGDWLIGAFAIYYALAYLDHPVSVANAIVIEAFLVLVRSTLFFVPADLGTQEGALVLITGGVTGSPELGLALSAIRRARDIVWIVWGLGIGWAHSARGDDSVADDELDAAAESLGRGEP